MIELLKLYFPNFESIEESVLTERGQNLGWQVTAFSTGYIPFGSGYHSDLNKARKIAIAEFIERSFVLKNRAERDAKSWRLDEHPTTCGFAAGFDPKNTVLRSAWEALERWSMSQWIDFNCPLQETTPRTLSNTSKVLLGTFSEYRTFGKSFAYVSNESIFNVELCVLVAFTDTGAFMGSAVRNSSQDALEHAVIEAYRHYLIAGQDRDFTRFPYNRIRFFAENRSTAAEALNKKRTRGWPQLEVEFQRVYNTAHYCIARTIFREWKPWNLGSIDRLLY